MSEVDTTQESTQETEQTDAQNVADMAQDVSDNEWHFAEGIKGAGDVPEWFKSDKYKTVADQAKAYKELEGKFGAFTGAPEEYKVKFSEEFSEKFEIDEKDPVLKSVKEFAKEINMDQKGFEGILGLYEGLKSSEQEQIEQNKTKQLEILGENGQTRIDNINAWAERNLDSATLEGFQEMAVSAKSIEAIERLISMTRPSKMSPNDAGPASADSEEELLKMMKEKDEYGNFRRAVDPIFRERYERLKNQVWGTEPYNRTI